MKNKKLRVIIATAAALLTGAGAVCLFLKRRKRTFYTMTAAILICGLMMGGALTAYATELDDDPDEVVVETDPDGDEYTVLDTIFGEEIEIDLSDLLNLFSMFGAIEPPTRDTSFTPPGNLTLVDDFYSVATDKQFITVQTRNGHYFYLVIDRSSGVENVHFLNQIDEYDLLQILQGEDFVAPPLPDDIAELVGELKTGDDEEPTAEPKQGGNNTGLLLGLLVIAAIGGGAFYYFKIRKPKEGGKKPPVKNELDEFDFDADENEFFIDSADEDGSDDGGEYDYSDGDNDIDEDIPDFTATPDSDDFSFEKESEDKR